TGGHGAGSDALADHILGHPAGVDDDVEIVLGDGHGSDEEGVHFNALRPASERHHASDFIESLAASQLERHFGGLLAKLTGVLPDRHGLRAERDAVEGSVVAILAG